VAHHTALKAKAMTSRRRAKEKQFAERPRPEASADVSHQLQPLLDKELSQLPDKYRMAIVLCDLEDQSVKEAARHLGCPQGTVASRLARARVMLAKRLARHGLGVSGGALAAVLLQNRASACVPTSVLSSTTKAASIFAAGQAAATGAISAQAAVLTEGVLKSMLLTKLKMVAAVVVLMAFVLGGGGLLTWARIGAGQAETPEDAQSKEQEKQANRKDEVKDAEAEAKLQRAEAAFQAAQAKLREAQAAVPEAAAMLRLQELGHGLREQRADLLLLALELEKQKGRVKLMKERLEYLLMRVEGDEEEKKSLAAAVRKVLDPLIEETVDAAERIEMMRQSNDVMLGQLAKGKQGTRLQQLQQLKKEVQEQKDSSDWPELELDRARERLVFFRGGFEREFRNAKLKHEDKKFLLDTLNKEIDPIMAKADEVNTLLGRVRVALIQSLQDEKEGTKADE
jgi:hypothetical protein